MVRDVLGFDEIDLTMAAAVGGKGANLGELSKLTGVSVPPGFCVTTGAYRRIVGAAPSVDEQLDRLSGLRPDDQQAIRSHSEALRGTIEGIVMPDDLAAVVTAALVGLGEGTACAVRSSATAEDLPTASFAGQQDTFLNVVGPTAILEHIRRCWASLFTERAVTYRLRNSIEHRHVDMAVVVQRMVFAEAAGVLFTADPLTGNRKVTSIEAVFGLSETFVSGEVNADRYQVRDGEIVDTTIATGSSALTDAQVVRLAELGRRIEAHFGRPQDIEWCLADDDFQIVQSRPITTLFPVPAAADDGNHVYISVGHQQMMTDPMKPLGISIWQLTAMAPMHEAGGRLFVDATRVLSSPAGRAGLLETFGRGDPLVRDAVETVLDRGDFVPLLPDAPPVGPPPGGRPAPIETDPAIVIELVERYETSLAHLVRDVQAKTGPALFDHLLAAFDEHKRILSDPTSMQAIMAGMEATWWLNDHLEAWLGDKNAADRLTLSAPGNITSEMGLELLDVADAIRPHPEVVAFLQDVDHDDFLDELPALEGGAEASGAIAAYLDRYGMRCAGEIDITRPRWCERPTTLVPLILDNVRLFEPGAAAQRFEAGQQEAERARADVLARLRARPDGEQEAEATERMIDRVRTFIGYREYPKYGIVSRFFVYKLALLREAERLVDAGVLGEAEDAFYLTFHELHEVARTGQVDPGLLRSRQEAFWSYRALTPPRVLTSEGEGIAGSFHRDDVPTGALVGLPVSVGTVEGRARVIADLADADLEAGDILVTTFTDPSWSPLFVAIAGLVTEVGGLMTHGAVIAREYGLPAVVGVAGATQAIRDGQRIRVDGTNGVVELLS